jgi:hypothetical protein
VVVVVAMFLFLLAMLLPKVHGDGAGGASAMR